MELTQEKLKELLHYSRKTGLFTRKVKTSNRINIGDVASCIEPEGYVKICVLGKIYRAHRLAFLYVKGCFPENDVDHKNGNRSDNRWCNLRHVSRQCNLRNRNTAKTKSGVVGVTFNKVLGKWAPKIGVNYKIFNLGVYKRLDDAVKARWEAERIHGFPNCNTTSTAYLYLKQYKLL